MKKIYIALIALAGIFVSCDDFLDTLPDNRADIDSQEKIKQLLISAIPTTSPAYVLEMMSDNADEHEGSWDKDGIFQEQAFYWKHITEEENDGIGNIWEGCYGAIATANFALQTIEELGDGPELQPLKGEALMCRAFAHYFLVTTFCKAYGPTSNTDLGVTYMKDIENVVKPPYERGTVAETYAKISEDIQNALPLIEDNTFPVPKYHFNRKAAYAFAARFYLYYQKFDQTIKYATMVLGAQPESVLRDWVYNQQFPVAAYVTDRGNAYINKDNKANLLLHSSTSTWPQVHGIFVLGDKYCHNSFIALNESTASRGPWGNNTYIFRDQPLVSPNRYVAKIDRHFEVTDPIGGTGWAKMIYPLFTTDETLLCRAEAYALSGDAARAVNDLNIFVKNFTTYSSTLTKTTIDNFYNGIEYYKPDEPTPKKELHPDFVIPDGNENIIHAVLQLRRVLTMHEGLRWMDINRYGITIHRRFIYKDGQTIRLMDTMDKNDPRRAIQIPADVIDGGLEPNPR